MLRIAKVLPAGNIPKPLDALALQWYYMSYHKSDREKFVLGGKTLKDATFFQALYEQKKLDGLLDHQEVERLKKRPCERRWKISDTKCATLRIAVAPITLSARQAMMIRRRLQSRSRLSTI